MDEFESYFMLAKQEANLELKSAITAFTNHSIDAETLEQKLKKAIALFDGISLDRQSTKKEDVIKVSSIEKNKAYAYFQIIIHCTHIDPSMAD